MDEKPRTHPADGRLGLAKCGLRACLAGFSAMAFCKSTWLAECRAGGLPSGSSPLRVSSRFRPYRAHSVQSSPSELALSALQPYVNDVGKPFLAILQASLLKEKQELQESAIAFQRERALQEKVNALLETELVRAQVDLLKARGLGNTRGLFEFVQEKLKDLHHCSSRLKGARLWELFLKADPELASCIESCTDVTASNVGKQAMLCYNVYSSLSEHIHDGKTLAELQAARQGGIIEFDKGPLTSVQVKILTCIGQAAQVHIREGMS